MPQKTKKQKIRAQLKRIKSPNETLSTGEPTATIVTSQVIQKAAENKHAIESSNDQAATTTIGDLKKTVVILSLLFALEFLIFYANLKGII